MQHHGLAYLESKLNSLSNSPVYGHIELTYRCDYNCIHCFSKCQQNSGKELTTTQIKKILDDIHHEGCIWLTISGGDPLIRPDFTDIYDYAKKKGFIITILTNGYRLNRKLVDHLAKHPPLSIDITLNSLDANNYAAITGLTKNALPRVLKNIQYASRKGLAIIIKANAMKINKHEISKIKEWAGNLPGKSKENLFNFRYDPIIYPRLNGDITPCRLRLNQTELDALSNIDPDLKKEKNADINKKIPACKVADGDLYFCDTFRNSFFITPFGRLKFCNNSERFSVDLHTVSFKHGFYKEFPKLTFEKFKTDSPCKTCRLRKICNSCPAAAYLETGNEEKPVKYFCRMAHNTEKAVSRENENH